MTRHGWLRALRAIAFLCGMVTLGLSIQWSAKGVSVKNPDLIYVGVFLGVLVTVVEFIWRKPGMESNKTMNTIGAIVYFYGIVTNSLGFLHAWGFEWGNFSQYLKDPISLVLAVLIGTMLEVIAEPMISWGLTGDSQADMFGNLSDLINTPAAQASRSQQQQYFQQKPNRQNQQGNQQNQNQNTQQMNNQQQSPDKNYEQRYGQHPNYHPTVPQYKGAKNVRR